MKWLLILGVAFIGVALSEIDTRTPNLQDVRTALNNISSLNISPVDISGLNIPINASKIPTVEEGEKLLQDKCEKKAGKGAYEKILAAREEVQTCVMSLVNVTELQDEMEKAKPTGDLDIVFKKYCKKSPLFQECVSNFTSTLEPCLEEQEKESKRIVHNITASLLNFICFNEGDRIALFIAEGGPECLQSKKEAIEVCVNQTAAGYINLESPLSSSKLPTLVLHEKECSDIKKIQECVVRELEGCEEPTPSNIVGSLFDYVWQMTPCNNMQHAGLRADDAPGPSSSNTLAATAAVVISAVVAAATAGSRLH